MSFSVNKVYRPPPKVYLVVIFHKPTEKLLVLFKYKSLPKETLLIIITLSFFQPKPSLL